MAGTGKAHLRPEGTALLRALPAGAAPFDAILLGIKPQMLAM